MIPEDGQGKGRTAGGLGPLFSGLIAATLIALTLLVAVALGMGEQEMIAQVEPSATETATPLSPLPPLPLPLRLCHPRCLRRPTPSPTFSPTPTSSATPTARLTLAPTNTRRPTPIPTKCLENPWRWDDQWRVKRGDNLSSISRATNTSVGELMTANCLTTPVIYAGQKLWVRQLPATPTRVPTRTPSVTPTPTPETPTPETPTPETPTPETPTPETPTPETPTPETPTPETPTSETPTPETPTRKHQPRKRQPRNRRQQERAGSFFARKEPGTSRHRATARAGAAAGDLNDAVMDVIVDDCALLRGWTLVPSAPASRGALTAFASLYARSEFQQCRECGAFSW